VLAVGGRFFSNNKKRRAKMKKAILLLMLALLPLSAFAQKDTREIQSQITFDISAGGPQGGVTSQADRSQVDAIVSQIRDAKVSGNVQRSEQLQKELDKVTGNTPQNLTSYNSGPQAINQLVNEPVSETDYNLTVLNSGDGNWATATSTDRVTGRIYVVTTKYNSAGSDTLKVFTSADNGISWVLINKIYYASAVKYGNDELDIEAINNGTTSYVYIAAGFSLSGVLYSSIIRYNSTGGEYFYINLYSSASGNGFFHARITSDNSKYTTAAYVYIILSQDTLLSTGMHNLRTKFSLITSPFITTPVMTYRNFNTSANSYWWNISNVADSTVMYNDIAFSDSAGFDRLVTATNFYRSGFNNLYMVYSSNYGATVPTYYPQIVEANINYKPRLAATGLDAAGLQYMMLTYVRRFSATDWDPYYQRTTNNGIVWTSGYVDAATDTTIYSDVIAVARIPNTFRFGYATMQNNVSGNAFVRTYNIGTLSARFQLNVSSCAVSFSPVRAGYRLTTTDSCFTIVQGSGGNTTYAYAGCSGALTGVGNNETPVSYKLSQNYPNPFNPTTKISYALPKSGLVTLKVYDILGKEVATLVNEVKNAGNYSVDFSASNFTSGVYFYKIETNGFSDIKKMMLIK
jgi:hypothetical protein